MAVNLCKNCRYHRHDGGWFCLHPEFGDPDTDVVTGEKTHTERLCRDVRDDEALCGREGKWFEPKIP